uniref:MFS-type transporter M6 n=1 Tax=Phoma sp. (strain ATCC 20986 / MF5453) TaxID=1828523 RepID=MFM6_PHOSM|nr:RecName: Full=MFS-type transporter M6; AltName: Full=Squalestatin S1 biosynthesis cluster protein M6 [Phoma sp. MF5453]AMY15063.1 MFS transporter [Phoma sp. MF5453]
MHRRRRDNLMTPAEMVASMKPPQSLSTEDDDGSRRDSESSADVLKSNEEFQARMIPEDDDANSVTAQPTWTVLSDTEIKSVLVVASFAAAISPFSTSTYYPAVFAISQDLGVSVSKINLTMSSYQIFQGVAPTITAAFADTYGRRPMFLVCFAIYFVANVGLALQNNFTTLLVLRCLQSTGSSGTFALAQAVTADITTRAERGRYLIYATLGSTLGPFLGPVIGGLLVKFLGWRSVFWFLLCMGTVFALLIFIFFGETARPIVGDGSVPPQSWNRSFLQIRSKGITSLKPNLASLERRKSRPNPLTSLALLWDRENFILSVSGGLLYAGYSSVTSVLASQLQQRYKYDAVQVGLCYLPVGFGSLLAYRTTVRLMDWNFEREAKKQGLVIVKNQQTDITRFDLEKARLGFVFPMILVCSVLLVAYGWQMHYHAPLAPILVTMFLIAIILTGVMNAIAALLTDVNRENAAAVGAAMNLTRLLLGAGAVAVVGPLNKSAGIGWTATVTAGLWVLMMPTLRMVYRDGFVWRAGENERVHASNVELAALVRS